MAEEIWHDSPERFLEAIGAVERKFPGSPASIALADALMRDINLPAPQARVFSAMLEHAVALVQSKTAPALDAALVEQAVEALNAAVKVNYCYDLDYLAGYAEHDATRIYIDREFAHREVAPYLVVHEVVEKCLLDYIRFSEHAYAYAHQIAQRIEEIAALAAGLSWQQYQQGIMEPEIERVTAKAREHRMRYLPPDLDLTPYRDSQDPDLPLIEALMHALPFSIEQWGAGIYHLLFAEPSVMAQTMMRFQEYYESPKFRGTYFTREAFIEWYSEEKKGAQYIEDWGLFGFNIPGEVFEPFYDGKFAAITPHERQLLDYFEEFRGKRFYVITTSRESPAEMKGHELAHALYYMDDAYRREVDEAIREADLEPLKHFLTTHPEYGNYHAAVLDDECHAYLSQTTQELADAGFDLAAYAAVIIKLQEIFKNYTVAL